MPLRRCRRSRRPTNRSSVHRVTLRCQPCCLEFPAVFCFSLLSDILKGDDSPTTTTVEEPRPPKKPPYTHFVARNDSPTDNVNTPRAAAPALGFRKESSAPKFVSSASVFSCARKPRSTPWSLLVVPSPRRARYVALVVDVTRSSPTTCTDLRRRPRYARTADRVSSDGPVQ